MVGALDRLPYFEDGGPAIMAPPAAVSIIPGRTELDRGGWITTYRVVTAAN